MSQAIHLELEVPDDLARLRLPAGVQQRLTELLDKQDTGTTLTDAERHEAEGRTRNGHGATHEPSAGLGNPGGGSAARKTPSANTSIRGSEHLTKQHVQPLGETLSYQDSRGRSPPDYPGEPIKHVRRQQPIAVGAPCRITQMNRNAPAFRRRRSSARLWEQLREYFEVRFRAEKYGVPYFLAKSEAKQSGPRI
jgi:hypothetical protein